MRQFIALKNSPNSPKCQSILLKMSSELASVIHQISHQSPAASIPTLEILKKKNRVFSPSPSLVRINYIHQVSRSTRNCAWLNNQKSISTFTGGIARVMPFNQVFNKQNSRTGSKKYHEKKDLQMSLNIVNPFNVLQKSNHKSIQLFFFGGWLLWRNWFVAGSFFFFWKADFSN